MSEENRMTEENKKTIIAFIAGLLVGGLLVFIFMEPSTAVVSNDDQEEVSETNRGQEQADDNRQERDTNEEEAPVTNRESGDSSDGAVTVADQEAGSQVHFSDASFPAEEGWVGVREYRNGQLSGLLGAARWDKSEGLSPTSVGLLRPTVAGQTYAIVFYTENGDRIFSLATDQQMQGVMETFEAR